MVTARMALAPIKAYAEEAWDAGSKHKVMAKAWWQQKRRIEAGTQQAAAAQCVDKNVYASLPPASGSWGKEALSTGWDSVRGPAGACWMAVKALAGHMRGPFLVAVAGHSWNLTHECPVDLMEELEHQFTMGQLRQWAQKEGREGSRPAPWMTPAKQLLGRKLTKQWTRKHRAVARTAVTGGFPEQRQLYLDGRVDSDKCPLCLEEVGTSQHLY